MKAGKKGHGLQTLQDLKKGQFIIEYVGRAPRSHPHHPPLYDSVVFPSSSTLQRLSLTHSLTTLAAELPSRRREILDEETYTERKKNYFDRGQRHYYFMNLTTSEVIDATSMGNMGRFVNHSCAPNCETQKWCAARRRGHRSQLSPNLRRC